MTERAEPSTAAIAGKTAALGPSTAGSRAEAVTPTLGEVNGATGRVALRAGVMATAKMQAKLTPLPRSAEGLTAANGLFCQA